MKLENPLSPDFPESLYFADLTSIVFIPAIGADPWSTWERGTEEYNEHLHSAIHSRLKNKAQVHLYDHLTSWERRLQIPRTSKGPLSEEQKQASDAFVDAERDAAEWGVDLWAERLLSYLQDFRKSREKVDRPIIFICHSTGGNVLKQALIKRSEGSPNEIANDTIGITFFAVPHHGSSALSNDEYVRAVQSELGNKWKMSRRLRRDFRLRGENEDLEMLNHKFAVDMVGVKIHSYAEIADTHLTVLTADAIGGEGTAVIRVCIVDSRSGRLGTDQAPVEDEDFMQLDVDHTGMPRFTGQEAQYELYLAAIEKIVTEYKDDARTAYRKLKKAIMTETLIHVHRFYGSKDRPMKVLLTKPTLERFLEIGPARAMDDRIEGRDQEVQVREKDTPVIVEQPKIDLQPASEQSTPKVATVPTFKVEAVEPDDTSDEQGRSPTSTLTPPSMTVPKNISPGSSASSERSVPRGSAMSRGSGAKTNKSTQPKGVSFASDPKDVDAFKEPSRAAPFLLPSHDQDRFRWIHVPCTHAGWVHQVLGRISEEKQDVNLHHNLLDDRIWYSQHNQSRHASPHAHFVRPSVNCLHPSGAEKTPSDGIAIPSSACNHAQFVVYLPYLHWDSFRNMEERAEIVKIKLGKDVDSEKIRKTGIEIATGRSTEHKLIWQYLTLDRPLHCRRTLDQYGYPSLQNTSVRDHDQILWKRTKLEVKSPQSQCKQPPNRMHEIRPSDRRLSIFTRDDREKLADNDRNTEKAKFEESHIPKVLMVDQLWLWIVDNETVVTFFPGRENDNHDGYSREGDVRSLIYQDINGDYANECHDPFDFAALVIRHAIKALLSKTSDRNLQVFRIFEEYISILTENQNRSYKAFRDSQNASIDALETEKHVHNKGDLNDLLELRDIEDELHTLEKLIRQQINCVDSMLIQYRKLSKKQGIGEKGLSFLHDTASFLTEHLVQISGMRESATAAKQAYRDLLDMKQKQANVIEAHLAGKQSQVAAKQSRTVMIFTIFTITFLPLSFFASVFGINSREWSENATDNGYQGYLPLHSIFTYMFTISFAVITVALLAAFSRPARLLAMRTWRSIASPFIKLFHSDNGQKASITGGTSGSIIPKASLVVKGSSEEEEERRHSQRLSTISRTYTDKELGEKFERDMEKGNFGDYEEGRMNGWMRHD